MPGTAGELKYKIGADTRGLKKSVDKGLGDVAKKAAAAVVGLVALKKAFDAFSASVDAAKHADTVVTDLAASFSRAGVDARAATEDFLAFAGEVQNLTGISDEMVSQAGTLGASFNILGDDLKDVTMAAVDLAKGQKMDLKAAMNLVVKSIASSTNALTRYGIEIDASASQGEKLEQVLAGINEKFGGAAATAVLTYAGRVEILKENYGDLTEEVGRAVTQSGLWNAIIVDSTEIVKGMTAEVKENKGWAEGWQQTLLSAAGAVEIALLHVAEEGEYAFRSFVAGGFHVLAALTQVGKVPFLIQIAFGKMADAVIGHFVDIALAATYLPGALGVMAGKAVVALEGLRVNVALNEETLRGQIKTVDEAAGAFTSMAEDEVNAAIATGAAYDEKRRIIESYIASLQDLANTIIVDPIEAGLGATGAGGDGAPPETGAGGTADTSAADALFAAEGRSLAEQMAFKAELYYQDALAFEAAQERKVQTAITVADQIGQAFGNTFAAMAAGTISTEEAYSRMAKGALDAVLGMVQKTILAYAAEAAAGAAASQASIPYVGPILAASAAAAMLGMVRSYLTKMHDGGYVGGSQSEVPALLERGEFVIDKDTVRAMDRPQGAGMMAPAFAGAGGGGGDTYNVYSSQKTFLPAQNADLARNTREQYRMIDKLKRRGWIEGGD